MRSPSRSLTLAPAGVSLTLQCCVIGTGLNKLSVPAATRLVDSGRDGINRIGRSAKQHVCGIGKAHPINGH